MKQNSKFIFILILLLLAAANSWQFYFKTYSQEDTVSIHEFPKEIGDWSSTEIPISENDLSILETKNAFTRRYVTPEGKEVVLFIVYSQTNRKVSHPPEICYSGGGLTILGNDVKILNFEKQKISLDTHRLFVESGPYQQVANYWFKIGNSYTSNYLKQQALIAIKAFLRQPSSSAMIRVAADVKDGNIIGADTTVKEFIDVILPVIPEYLP